MSNYKDRLKQNQSGADIPKMDIGMRLTAKAKENKPGFVYMKEENGSRVEAFGNFAIKGILIGHGMVLSAYSKDIGAKGGSFHSTVYFKKSDTITLFGPTPSGYKKEMSGNLDQVEDFLTVKRRTIPSLDKTKKQMILYILTEKKGLVEIRTNLTLGFDQIKQVQKGSCEFLVEVSAAMYSDKNPVISAGAKKILGALAEKNPPCYCTFKLTDIPIDDTIAEKYDLVRHLDDFDRFKNYASNAIPDVDDDSGDNASLKPRPPAKGTAFDDNTIDNVSGEAEDDLPF